jgi:hypothetical protein
VKKKSVWSGSAYQQAQDGLSSFFSGLRHFIFIYTGLSSLSPFRPIRVKKTEQYTGIEAKGVFNGVAAVGKKTSTVLSIEGDSCTRSTSFDAPGY